MFWTKIFLNTRNILWKKLRVSFLLYFFSLFSIDGDESSDSGALVIMEVQDIIAWVYTKKLNKKKC